jgi:dihydroorotate dehydrogenase
MDFPMILGAGVCKNPSGVKIYSQDDVSLGAVVSGSYTPLPREGNSGKLFYPESLEEVLQKGYGLNSFGMPNMGFKKAHEEFSAMGSLKKPLIISLAGFGVQDYISGVATFGRDSPFVSGIELNFGCPNAHDKKTEPIAYDLASMEEILFALNASQIDCPVWVKISPYLTSVDLKNLATSHPELNFENTPAVDSGFADQVARLAMKFSFVRALICSNTVPNVITKEKITTTPNNGKAGLSGPATLEIGLKQASHMARILKNTPVDVIGAGGILSGNDAVKYFNAGCKGVSCTSGPFWSNSGPRFFAEMMQESEELQEFLMR